MAFLAADQTEDRLKLIDSDKAAYMVAVQEAIKLQADLTTKFLGIMDKWMRGSSSRKFLLESHIKFMKDIGKRNLVISRLNQDLDCVEIRDP